MNKLPKKITSCPIIEAILEIRYTPNVPKNAVFGVFYSMFTDENFQVKNLPILQLPEDIRANDPALIYSPHYEMQKDNFIIKIGPNVINFSISNKYPGWDVFVNKIFRILDRIESNNFISKYNRLGIRYINFFGSNIFDNLHISIKLQEEELDEEKITLQTEKYNQGVLSKLRIVNNSRLTILNKINKGSIIDIDCIKKYQMRMNFRKIIRP